MSLMRKSLVTIVALTFFVSLISVITALGVKLPEVFLKEGSSTTNFSLISDSELSSVAGVVIEDVDYGKVEYQAPLDLSSLEVQSKLPDLDYYLKFDKGKLSVDSDSFPELDRKAKIYLYGVTLGVNDQLGFIIDDQFVDTTQYSLILSDNIVSFEADKLGNFRVLGLSSTSGIPINSQKLVEVGTNWATILIVFVISVIVVSVVPLWINAHYRLSDRFTKLAVSRPRRTSALVASIAGIAMFGVTLSNPLLNVSVTNIVGTDVSVSDVDGQVDYCTVAGAQICQVDQGELTGVRCRATEVSQTVCDTGWAYYCEQDLESCSLN